MSHFDRCVLSFLLFLACLLVVRESEYLFRAREQRPQIVVSVSGAVARPGVIQLPADGRAVHAIELCGGLAAEADHEALELARPLADGEHLVVPRKATPVAPPALSLSTGEVAAAATTAEAFQGDLQANDTAPILAGPGAPLDLNLASASELESLPGVGPVMAQRIVQARQAAPGATFGSLEELRAIRGIKAKTFLRLRPYLKIEGP